MVNVPQAAPAHPGPVAVHVTPPSETLGLLETKLALNCNVWPWSMSGGREGTTDTTMSEDGGLLPQPHINTRIESARASFFINLCLPYYRNTSLRTLGISRLTTGRRDTGGRRRAECLKGKMMKLHQTLPRAAAKSDGTGGRGGLSNKCRPTVCPIRKQCDRLTWKLTKPEAPPQKRATCSKKCSPSSRTPKPYPPSPESAPLAPGKDNLYFYLRPKVMSILLALLLAQGAKRRAKRVEVGGMIYHAL